MRPSEWSRRPDIDDRPPRPRQTWAVALVGCGGIAKHHLEAYRDHGLSVVALCDLNPSKAEQLRQQFFPKAQVYSDHLQLLTDQRVQVVDVATHPEERIPLIRDCLLADKHVLSQKPFVLEIAAGKALCDLADQRGLVLAVNQNGRYAPHFAFLRRAVEAGWLGQTHAAHLSVHWDHSWVAGTPFEKIQHLILYDFAIHWFDILRCLLPQATPTNVYATTNRVPGQRLKPDLAAQVLVEFDHAQASLVFDGWTQHGSQDRTIVIGEHATAISVGPDLQQQTVTISDPLGSYTPRLQGRWFSDGFAGTMLELLCAIEQQRPCTIAARDNLVSLQLCFAAIKSSVTGKPQAPDATHCLPH